MTWHRDTLSVGVEEEFHIVDGTTRTLVNEGARLVAALPDVDDNRFSHEIKQSMVESATGICHTLAEVRASLVALRSRLTRTAADLGLAVAASGTVPLGHWRDGALTPNERYARILDLHQQVVWEQIVCGCHVHIGFADRELALQVLNRVRPWLSPLLALSTSSPYWSGYDTGYASYRTTVWWRWPTAHIPSAFQSTAEYDAVVAALVDTGTVIDDGQVYWDVRLSRKQHTLEFRVADTCTTVDEAVLHAALCRALAATAMDEAEREAPLPPVAPELLRAAKWRAARFGVSELLMDPVKAESLPARDLVGRLLEHVRPALESTGDYDEVVELTEQVLRTGTSADRQRNCLARSGELADVVDHLVEETRPA